MFGFLAAAALVARGAAKASRGGEVIAPTHQAQNQPFQPFPAQPERCQYKIYAEPVEPEDVVPWGHRKVCERAHAMSWDKERQLQVRSAE